MNHTQRMAFWLALIVIASTARGEEQRGDPGQGQVVYERYCMSCHGELGDGNGEFAAWITPKPRDYRQGIFKWRSTPSGSLPLPSDLERTIENGVYSTYMPAWYAIGHRARRDVIAYIQTFSPRWKNEQPGSPIPIPPETPDTAESVSRGQAVYEKNECAKCHGASGRGGTPSAESLKDEWGNPIAPADLTQGHRKCGDTPVDLYRVFMTGLGGTPMPSYGEAMSSDEAWDLVHYLRSLQAQQGNRDNGVFRLITR